MIPRLAIFVLIVTAAQAQLSPWYHEALRDVIDLEPSDIARIEQAVAANPHDFSARLKLMAYHQRADRAGRPEDRAKRVRHVLWLLENHPDSEILRSHVATLMPSDLTPEQFERVMALRVGAAKANPANATLQWNAAAFFAPFNRALYLQYLEATVVADPNHASAIRTLAQIYARELLDGGPLADHARAALESSKNVWVLGNTAYTLQSFYNERLQRGVSAAHGAALAERYFLRAKALDPTLDRRKILPQIDLQAIARAREAEAQARREYEKRIPEAVARIRRLPVDAFPELPPAIAGALRARHCLVPQYSLEGRHNVIRGQFFHKGESGWAVLCSDGNSTALLAFRNDRDTNPDTVVAREDSTYLQGVEGNRIAYSRAITAVGRDFIMSHYRAHGGPEPPPIDHNGIDDAFLEKASVTWYFHEGKWLALPGAD